MQEIRDWFRGWEDPLEYEIATHSSILAEKIPRIEEPGGLQSMGLHKSWTWLSTQAWQGWQREKADTTVSPFQPRVGTAHPPQHSFPLNPQYSPQLFPISWKWNWFTDRFHSFHLYALDSICWSVKCTSKHNLQVRKETQIVLRLEWCLTAQLHESGF